MRKAAAAAIAGAVMLVIAAVAIAVPASQTLTYSESFAAKKPSTNTTTKFSTSSSDPGNTANNGQPVSTSEVDVKFPAGTAVDYKSIPTCTATDNQITQSGGTVCASKTQVATGSATAALPFAGGAPIQVQLTAWNGVKELKIYVKPSIGQPFVLHAKLTGNVKNGPTLVTPTPPNCLPPAVAQNGRCVNPNTGQPGQEAVLTSFTLATAKKGTTKKPYIKSPKTCPKSKKWVFTGTFKYEDGTAKSLTSTSPCSK